MEDYLDFDRQEDVLSSLEEFCASLERAKHSDRAWKYVMISAHNALQGCICIALRNGNAFQTWNERHLKKWLEAYRKGDDLPDPKLNFFLELYDKLFENEGMLDRGNIEWLNETRNGLVHFNTDSYAIHKPSILDACDEAFQAIMLTPQKSQGIFFYTEDQEKDFSKLVSEIRELMKWHRANA
ncbi:MAG: hypothetical protein R3280_04100 [Marinobacter sp.]|uniref:hypothetical protein n=1 Tax=Marinobacter sp. TaxID=50741 RepID=UPI00299D8703|nr:hypothetical protein [Marinobacter sp.]MDX1633794.1 hypothetical protein [Marinobacter sp.]